MNASAKHLLFGLLAVSLHESTRQWTQSISRCPSSVGNWGSWRQRNHASPSGLGGATFESACLRPKSPFDGNTAAVGSIVDGCSGNHSNADPISINRGVSLGFSGESPLLEGDTQ